MNLNDVNSVLASLEDVSIHRSSEVKLAALLDKFPRSSYDIGCQLTTNFRTPFSIKQFEIISKDGERAFVDEMLQHDFIPTKEFEGFYFLNDCYPKRKLEVSCNVREVIIDVAFSKCWEFYISLSELDKDAFLKEAKGNVYLEDLIEAMLS